MTTTNPTIEYVKPGGCMSLDESTATYRAAICVLERNQCPLYFGSFYGPETYWSSLRISENSADPFVLGCLDYIFQVQMGRCGDAADKEICTGHPSACSLPSSFIPLDSWCRVLDDTAPGSPVGQTQFGSCVDFSDANYNDQHCYWSHADCVQNSTYWFSPNSVTITKPCPCEKVETGACFRPTDNVHYCAVSSDGCDEGHVFKTVHQLRD